MQVLVAFDRAYAGAAADAVWIVDTSENRSWFEQQTGKVDANSAIFSHDATPLTVIWHVFDHHPEWTEIVIRGAPLTTELEEAVKSDALVIEQDEDEFKLGRR